MIKISGRSTAVVFHALVEARSSVVLCDSHIFSELTAFFLQAKRNDLISCLGGNILKVKGYLITVLTEPVGSDHIGQTDDRFFLIRNRDDQLNMNVTGRLISKQR